MPAQPWPVPLLPAMALTYMTRSYCQICKYIHQINFMSQMHCSVHVKCLLRMDQKRSAKLQQAASRKKALSSGMAYLMMQQTIACIYIIMGHSTTQKYMHAPTCTHTQTHTHTHAHTHTPSRAFMMGMAHQTSKRVAQGRKQTTSKTSGLLTKAATSCPRRGYNAMKGPRTTSVISKASHLSLSLPQACKHKLSPKFQNVVCCSGLQVDWCSVYWMANVKMRI